jgi:outer membrane protein TolC
MALSRERMELLRRQVEVGLAGQLEVKRAELAVLEAEVELQRMKRELAALSPRAK